MNCKIVSTFVLISFFLFNISYANQFQFGIKSGIIISKINSSSIPDETIDPLIDFDGGVVLIFTISNHFQIESNLLYSPKGFKPIVYSSTETSFTLNRIDCKTKVHCISLPVLFHYSFFKYYYFTGGPRLDYLLYEDNQLSDWFSRKKLDKLEFGYDYGFGINKQFLGNLLFSLEIRYSPTISEYFKNSRYSSWEILFGIGI